MGNKGRHHDWDRGLATCSLPNRGNGANTTNIAGRRNKKISLENGKKKLQKKEIVIATFSGMHGQGAQARKDYIKGSGHRGWVKKGNVRPLVGRKTLKRTFSLGGGCANCRQVPT